MSNARPGKPTQDDVDRLERVIAELRASRRRLAEATHADRRALERELHDGVQQHIAALAIVLQRLLRIADGDVAAASALVAEMRGIVREAFDESARLATRIYPRLLEGRGLASALRSAASSSGVTADVDVAAEAGHPPEITAELYWAWIEALSCASAGSEAAISVLDTDGRLTFEISVTRCEPGAGLERLRDRIEAVGGHASIEGPPDGRSLVQGWLPLPR